MAEKQVGKVTIRLTLDKKQFEQALGGATNDLEKKTEQAAVKARQKLNRQMKELGKDMAIIGAAITAAFTAAIVKVVGFGDELWDLSQKTNISVETLSVLKQASDLTGTSFDSLTTGIRAMSKQMVAANEGKKEAIGLFKDLGISIYDTNGNLKTQEQMLMDVTAALNKMPDGAKKTALQVELLGKAGMELGAAIKAVPGLKPLITSEQAKRANDVADAWARMKAHGKELLTNIVSPILPKIEKLVNDLDKTVQKISDWAKENPKLASGLMEVGGKLGSVLLIIGSVLILLPKLTAAWKAFQALFITNPVGLALTAIALFIIDILTHLEELKIGTQLTLNDMKLLIFEFLDKIAGPINTIWRAIFGKDLINVLDNTLNIIKTKAEQTALETERRLLEIESGRGARDRTGKFIPGVQYRQPIGPGLLSGEEDLGKNTKDNTEATDDNTSALDRLTARVESLNTLSSTLKVITPGLSNLPTGESGIASALKTEYDKIAEEINKRFAKAKADAKKAMEASASKEGTQSREELKAAAESVYTKAEPELNKLAEKAEDVGNALRDMWEKSLPEKSDVDLMDDIIRFTEKIEEIQAEPGADVLRAYKQIAVLQDLKERAKRELAENIAKTTEETKRTEEETLRTYEDRLTTLNRQYELGIISIQQYRDELKKLKTDMEAAGIYDVNKNETAYQVETTLNKPRFFDTFSEWQDTMLSWKDMTNHILGDVVAGFRAAFQSIGAEFKKLILTGKWFNKEWGKNLGQFLAETFAAIAELAFIKILESLAWAAYWAILGNAAKVGESLKSAGAWGIVAGATGLAGAGLSAASGGWSGASSESNQLVQERAMGNVTISIHAKNQLYTPETLIDLFQQGFDALQEHGVKYVGDIKNINFQFT